MDFTLMGKKPDKPEKPKKMTAKEQSARFIQTARELDADESGESFRKAADRILQPKSKQNSS